MPIRPRFSSMEREHPINLVHVTKPFIGITVFMTTYKMCIFTADIYYPPLHSNYKRDTINIVFVVQCGAAHSLGGYIIRQVFLFTLIP